ncbi:hypothetical protein [Bradyrhizobium sp.]|uniref:hypothetical protein n=1 Tax=Bradyrhizobium sp. TaxID=376 RepID=UPI003C4728C9
MSIKCTVTVTAATITAALLAGSSYALDRIALQPVTHAGTARDSFEANTAAAKTNTAITIVSARNFMFITSLRGQARSMQA